MSVMTFACWIGSTLDDSSTTPQLTRALKPCGLLCVPRRFRLPEAVFLAPLVLSQRQLEASFPLHKRGLVLPPTARLFLLFNSRVPSIYTPPPVLQFISFEVGVLSLFLVLDVYGVAERVVYETEISSGGGRGA